jgi:hypothetical protein
MDDATFAAAKFLLVSTGSLTMSWRLSTADETPKVTLHLPAEIVATGKPPRT